MEEALKHEPVKQFKPPEGVVGVYVNPENGLLATKECPVSRLAYYVKGTEPTKYCMEHLDNMEEPKNSGRKKRMNHYGEGLCRGFRHIGKIRVCA